MRRTTLLLLVALAASGCEAIPARDEHGMTALMRAAREGQTDEVKRLLDRAAPVNDAVPSNDLQALIAFISWMQDVPDRDPGWTPLHYACAGGHEETARLLIDRGADLDYKARGGTVPLDVTRDARMAKLLLDAGARARNASPSRLMMAVATHDDESLQLLLEAGADPNGSMKLQGITLLHAAARQGNAQATRQLLDAGADWNCRDSLSHWTPLMWATHEHHDEVAELLRARGAREDGVAEDALQDATRRGDLDAVRVALADGAQVNARGEFGAPALRTACERGHAEVVRELLRAGAQVGVRGSGGTTEMYEAAMDGQVEIVELLLQAGADPRAPKEHSLAVAAHMGHADVVRLLLQAGAPPTQGVVAAAWQGHAEVLRMLLDAGGDANAAEGGDLPALTRAAGLGRTDCVILLLQRGAAVDAPNVSGSTALMSTAWGGHHNAARALIAAGADVNHRNEEGQSALDVARRRGDADMVRLLESAGAR